MILGIRYVINYYVLSYVGYILWEGPFKIVFLLDGGSGYRVSNNDEIELGMGL